MQYIRNILCALHGLEYRLETLQRACALAISNQARLEIAVLHPEFSEDLSAYLADFKSRMLDDLGQAIAGIASEWGYNGKDFAEAIPIHFHNDKPGFVSIIQQVVRESHDLLIKQPQTGESGKHRRGFKSLDMSLLRKAPCPVWLDRNFQHPEAPRIVIAVDPDSDEPRVRDLGVKLLQTGTQMAYYLGAQCDVLACWEFEYEGYLRNAPFGKKNSRTQVDTMLSETREDHEKTLEALIDAAGVDRGNLNIVLERGDPGEVIPDYIKKHDCDLLVMGTVARSGIPALFIGNTAEDVMQSLHCSMLAIKPDDFETLVDAE
jgi:nucleotide-binding universal stress UspA family protein